MNYLKQVLYVLILILLGMDTSLGQRIGVVSFESLPQDSQLFPRNNANLGSIPIKGYVEQSGYSYVSAVLTREGQSYSYQKGAITYLNGSVRGSFSITNLSLKAELAEYEVKIYLVAGQDSTLLISREHLVSGDFYVVNGQSNAYAFNIGNEPFYFENKYIRTFGVNMGSEADTLWLSSSPQVGAWALALQKFIVQNAGIPSCVINGAVPGTSISQHFRDQQNPLNLGTIYGSLLYRVQKAKAVNHIRAFFWAQGENDTFEHSTTYSDDFKKLYQYWQIDYPSVEQFVVFQNNVLPLPANTGASIRNFQRLTSSLFPKTLVFSQVGIETIDGIHHSNKGYFTIASNLYKILAPLFYGMSDDINNHSPNIQRAYFTDSLRNAITLEFPRGTQMISVADTTVLSPYTGNSIKLGIKDYIYFDNDETKVVPIDGISYMGNRVTLFFTKTIPHSKIDYLPNRYYTVDFHQFIGPCLRSKNFVNACSFYDLNIEHENTAPLNNPTVTVAVLYYNHAIITWNAINKATSYVIEILKNGNYEPFGTFNAPTLGWEINDLNPNTSYQCRLIAKSSTASSDYIYFYFTTPAKLSTPVVEGAQISLTQNRINWNLVDGANTYVLERKVEGGDFSLLVKLGGTERFYLDSAISLGKTYTYRLKAFGNLTESEESLYTIKVQNALQVPSLKLNSIYTSGNGTTSLEITWKTIQYTQKYLIEKKQIGQVYNSPVLLDSTKSSYQEKNLVPNTTYIFRIKAINQLAESPYDSLVLVTPQVLSTPTLVLSEDLANRLIKGSWTEVTGATSYQISRSIEGYADKSTKVLTARSFVDSTFIQKANYTYLLKAFGTNTESAIATQTITTSLILANEPLAVESLVYPNPCHDFLIVQLPYLTSGQIDLLDIQGKVVKSIDFRNQERIEVSLQSLPSGVYFTRIQTVKAIWNSKILVMP
ncbi:MAG: T9SS type A sorting domain-containing protein [Flectobacillus sp.]|uniref:T9SS type A sorting domain-containing protein n=1 Tax=Flectobacillus sp. TaxID=50419 RepID=UPI003B99AECA